MSGSRQVVDVLSLYAGGCDAISDAARGDRRNSDFGRLTALDKQAALARAIEVEIIPRLMLAHRQMRGKNGRGRFRQISGEQVKEFAAICVRHDATVAHAYADALLTQGATIELIYTDLFAPAARLLGEMWEEDSASFAEVTIGLSRIQQLVHHLSPFYEPDEDPDAGAGSCLLINMPGEDHCLGLLLVEEFFRRAGWNVWTPQNVSAEQLISIVRQERFDMVGISVTCEVDSERLKSIVQSVKAVSLNPALLVMVGGRFINEHPDYVAKVGADATDFDGSHAVRRIEAIRPKLQTS